MLVNFLSNALKFTNEEGTITVRIDILEHQLVKKESLSQSP
jgi:signal transduction histidine kinase